jgi:membrane-associated phospholipid phosphatase
MIQMQKDAIDRRHARRGFTGMPPMMVRWIIAWCVCGGVLVTSYSWIDAPVAYFVHDSLSAFRPAFDAASRIPKVLGTLVVACTLALGVRVMAGRNLPFAAATIVLSSLSLAFSDIVENWLKFAFGRTWPETWIQNNPSLIRDGVHHFNPFHGGPGFASVPSGHLLATCAIVSVFWLRHPGSRPACVATIAAVFVGLLGADYHFVSDLIAGGIVGFFIGHLVVAIWNTKGTL